MPIYWSPSSHGVMQPATPLPLFLGICISLTNNMINKVKWKEHQKQMKLTKFTWHMSQVWSLDTIERWKSPKCTMWLLL
ncbi:hypothetical protein GOP47_0021963 [Adiantum capillus-veneris]|uniref:Uncharacterized protein n=1 Tax=Adiantum capillus-veneris TaxID=13818 RepID=A0A9D4Z8C2_ADICA|nr:hypothetical protein GOP47_0021963 [Adiantum capillus-veneris]